MLGQAAKRGEGTRQKGHLPEASTTRASAPHHGQRAIDTLAMVHVGGEEWMHDRVIRHIVDVDKLRLIPKKHVASPLARVSPRSHSCKAWLNQTPL